MPAGLLPHPKGRIVKEYTVVRNGVEHTMLLEPEDAKRLGAKEPSSKKAEPANKSRASSAKTKD